MLLRGIAGGLQPGRGYVLDTIDPELDLWDDAPAAARHNHPARITAS